MSAIERLANGARNLLGTQTPITAFTPVAGYAARPDSETAIFDILRALYDNNDCWRRIGVVGPTLVSLGLDERRLRGLRNPSQAAVDFYTAVLMAGDLEQALPLAGDARLLTQIEPAAQQLWQWSNWAAKKQVYVRTAANLGECYLQVATKPDDGDPQRVYLEVIQPDAVRLCGTERDERGFLTRIRIEVPERDPQSIGAVRWHVEVWDKATQDARFWTLPSYPPADEREWPAPERIVPFAAMRLDFIPFVHVPFMDIGGERGMTPLLLAYDKILELDQLASSLHQALYEYNKPEDVYTSQMTADGVTAGVPSVTDTRTFEHSGRTQTFLPPGWERASNVVPINYAGQLSAIEAHWNALRDTTLPELHYWSMADASPAASGQALETRMKGAISRAVEARGNLEAGLVRAMQMGFSVAAAWGLEPFTALGAFADGGMEFGFARRDIIPLTDDDRADLLVKRGAALASLVAAGSNIEAAAVACGFDADTAKALAQVDLNVVQPVQP